MHVMALDPTVQVAIIGIITAFVAALGAIVVAIVNSKKERRSTAETAMEATLRERILLRDEQIAELREDLWDREKAISDRELAIQARDQIIEKLQTELRVYKDGM